MNDISEQVFRSNVWTPEDRSLVVSMQHPTFNDEPDANIRSFDDKYERDAFIQELNALDRGNQMHLVKPTQYAYYGISRTVIDGRRVFAKTSMPFGVRIDSIEEEMREISRAEDTEVGQINDRIAELQEQIAMLTAHNKVESGDRDAAARKAAMNDQEIALSSVIRKAKAKEAARQAAAPSVPFTTTEVTEPEVGTTSVESGSPVRKSAARGRKMSPERIAARKATRERNLAAKGADKPKTPAVKSDGDGTAWGD